MTTLKDLGVGPDAWETRSKPKLWEKTVRDPLNANENWSKARDLGIARINYSRLSLVAELSKDDSVDYYKFNAISRGNLRISIRDSDAANQDDDLPELDANEYIKAAGIAVEETALDQAEKQKSQFEEILANLRGKNTRMQLFTIKNGKEVVVADSTAEEGSTEFDNFESLSYGEYRLRNSQMFYLKISRIDETKSSDVYQYTVQVQIGDNHKHDYLTTETVTKSSTEYEGKKGAYVSSAGQAALDALTAYNVANLCSEAQTAFASLTSNGHSYSYNATQAAANLISDGYLNISSLQDYNASTAILGGTSSNPFDILKANL